MNEEQILAAIAAAQARRDEAIASGDMTAQTQAEAELARLNADLLKFRKDKGSNEATDHDVTSYILRTRSYINNQGAQRQWVETLDVVITGTVITFVRSGHVADGDAILNKGDIVRLIGRQYVSGVSTYEKDGQVHYWGENAPSERKGQRYFRVEAVESADPMLRFEIQANLVDSLKIPARLKDALLMNPTSLMDTLDRIFQ